ncbi:hypothetical protein GUJ93_ZPchr0001g29404 [Zizania palustris]|uniref:Uncharacterized protein n=1 Tax=Zizania palustris TaxID=103762 RepID=A0A8J5VA17_ZIZPA|nr:hypothetical protein GUJ93_ZPchr0001g29404 [Zizania palustris]
MKPRSLQEIQAEGSRRHHPTQAAILFGTTQRFPRSWRAVFPTAAGVSVAVRLNRSMRQQQLYCLGLGYAL